MEKDNFTDNEIKQILQESRSIAVIGMSRDPLKPAHYVPKFLIKHGYQIFPVNPLSDEIMGLKSYQTILEIPVKIDIANIFRRSEDVLPQAEKALEKGIKIFWMQEGIYNKKAVKLLQREGSQVLWNRCMMKEYIRLFQS
jgi:predicted CoA-binding protein